MVKCKKLKYCLSRTKLSRSSELDEELNWTDEDNHHAWTITNLLYYACVILISIKLGTWLYAWCANTRWGRAANIPVPVMAREATPLAHPSEASLADMEATWDDIPEAPLARIETIPTPRVAHRMAQGDGPLDIVKREAAEVVTKAVVRREQRDVEVETQRDRRKELLRVSLEREEALQDEVLREREMRMLVKDGVNVSTSSTWNAPSNVGATTNTRDSVCGDLTNSRSSPNSVNSFQTTGETSSPGRTNCNSVTTAEKRRSFPDLPSSSRPLTFSNRSSYVPPGFDYTRPILPYTFRPISSVDPSSKQDIIFNRSPNMSNNHTIDHEDQINNSQFTSSNSDSSNLATGVSDPTANLLPFEDNPASASPEPDEDRGSFREDSDVGNNSPVERRCFFRHTRSGSIYGMYYY